MNFNEIIKLLMKKQRFTNQDNVADYLEMSRANYWKMKRGEISLQDKVIAKIMDGSGLEAPEIERAWKAEFAKEETVRKSWESWRAAGAIAIFSIVIGGISSLPSVGYANNLDSNNGYYAQLCSGSFCRCSRRYLLGTWSNMIRTQYVHVSCARSPA